MPKFIVKSSEIIYYKNIIEAETEEEARKLNAEIFYDGLAVEDGFDSFQVDDIYELKETEVQS